ncbi:arsenate-mycothiol transferase ArsC [Profundibacterium mesophilum]|uniref:Ribose 5-phosphate isomerase B n=1 Tax=Profundibacterium mesophilum KAUST100406-0324 TaxID=1037889 RepID=A0A921TCG5_9RHOB|nr:low molecular weight phosphatase family protein [Profundibacterium mesophilum]KAF0675643.1 ribose 5-phosphate isomerase B [Profundibacterium mesophilum KAUST100406-0324]
MARLPRAVLFCCDQNAVRSPMAEGIMKRLHGRALYVQSAGLRGELEIDGFAVAVCREIGVELERHRTRSFDEMRDRGDDLSGFDLVVALSPASRRRALDLTRDRGMRVEYWPVATPVATGDGREAILDTYRQTRDRILQLILERFGPATEHA